jgi:hypothetical protein
MKRFDEKIRLYGSARGDLRLHVEREAGERIFPG